MTKAPIAVHIDDPSTSLTRTSRVWFGRTYSIEMHVKVKSIGQVIQEHLGRVIEHYTAEIDRRD